MSGKVTGWSIRRKDERTGRLRISSVEEVLYLTYTGQKNKSDACGDANVHCSKARLFTATEAEAEYSEAGDFHPLGTEFPEREYGISSCVKALTPISHNRSCHQLEAPVEPSCKYVYSAIH